jgi:hypothetical protein
MAEVLTRLADEIAEDREELLAVAPVRWSLR